MRDKSEPGLLLVYLDDSESMDPLRTKYGEWAIRLFRSIKIDDPAKVGVHLATFRSNVIGISDLQLTGKSTLESAIIDYEDSRKEVDGKKPETRDTGTSLKEVLKDAYRQIEESKATTVLLVVFCDGGVEDGKHGDLPGALAAAKKLETPPSSVSNLRVLMLGISGKSNGALIRAQQDFWNKVKVDYQLGKDADTDAIIAASGEEFGSLVK